MAARNQLDQSEFSENTRRWHSRTLIEQRKALGQYMTPRPIRERLLDQLELRPGMSVLDPGVGTGEFLVSVLAREPGALVTGWDVDPYVLAFARESLPGAELIERSALDPHDGPKFDLVIGNPPYFQFRASKEIKAYFSPVISGRPNIFALFFQAALEAVKPGGRVAFVVPPSMNNGAYFEALRTYITTNSDLEHLEILDGNSHFEGASTAIQLIVMRAGPGGHRYFVRKSCAEAGFTRTVLAETPELIERQFEGRPTLWDLGYQAVTGKVVWNQERRRLRRQARPGTVPLIWAHNIQGGRLQLDPRHNRPQYITGQPALKGPMIVVNRIVGAVGSGTLRAALVPEGMDFAGENHVNVIGPRAGARAVIGIQDLHHALQDERLAGRIQGLTGNTQLSATELTHLLPLDLPAEPVLGDVSGSGAGNAAAVVR